MADYKPEAEPKAWADEVPVYCAHDAIVAVEKLIPNPANPNTHPDEQIQALGRVIRYQGWRSPITVSTRSGLIVKGHGRLGAALLEGFKEVPVDYQNYASEADEYADLVADNRLAELSEIDQKKLADIFAEIDTGEINMEMTGYTDKEIENLVTALSEALHDDKPEVEPDDIQPGQAITKPGDLWILGRHRIVCGSSSIEPDLELLLDGAKPEIQIEGSSATLIATESKGQPAYIMGTEPAFVDTIVQRYIKTTGKTTGIRLFRKGKELGHEHFKGIFSE